MSASSRGSDAQSAAASKAGGSYRSSGSAASLASSHRSHHRRRSSAGGSIGTIDISDSDPHLFELACNRCQTSFQGIETVIPDCNCMLCPGE
jgi:hypothetical protein